MSETIVQQPTLNSIIHGAEVLAIACLKIIIFQKTTRLQQQIIYTHINYQEYYMQYMHLLSKQVYISIYITDNIQVLGYILCILYIYIYKLHIFYIAQCIHMNMCIYSITIR